MDTPICSPGAARCDCVHAFFLVVGKPMRKRTKGISPPTPPNSRLRRLTQRNETWRRCGGGGVLHAAWRGCGVGGSWSWAGEEGARGRVVVVGRGGGGGGGGRRVGGAGRGRGQGRMRGEEEGDARSGVVGGEAARGDARCRREARGGEAALRGSSGGFSCSN